MAEKFDVVVIGAGVIGCSVAYYLAREGIKVALLERESFGSGSSAHATGFISLLGTEFTPGPSFQFGLESYREFPSLVAELEDSTGMDLLYQRRPSLRLALEESEEQLIKDLMTWQQEHVAMRWISSDDVHELEPRLTPSLIGAVYEDESAQLDSYRLNLALAAGAEKKGTQTINRNVTGLLSEKNRITGVQTEQGDISCGTVVVAAGLWSPPFQRDLDFPIPVGALKGERLLLKYDGDPLQLLISSPKRGHMISRLDGFLSVGSTGGRDYDQDQLYQGADMDRVPTETARVEIMQRAIDVFPDLENAELFEQLAGSRPLSPDRIPIIGPVPGKEGVVLATGHTTKGIHLGPSTAKAVTQYIQGGCKQVPSSMELFLPDRFAGMTEADFQTAGLNVDE
ncbi:MAG TPA: FAD-binding oxidoreductase [Dehalococcoidia bacterium]|nr:FAD-binding oxidoreductase [Dehalococcoidia bacterium]